MSIVNFPSKVTDFRMIENTHWIRMTQTLELHNTIISSDEIHVSLMLQTYRAYDPFVTPRDSPRPPLVTDLHGLHDKAASADACR